MSGNLKKRGPSAILFGLLVGFGLPTGPSLNPLAAARPELGPVPWKQFASPSEAGFSASNLESARKGTVTGFTMEYAGQKQSAGKVL